MRPRDTYKKYILQKNWVKTVIPAFSSGQNNLPPSIWGPSRQLDDQHRNTNMNDKDHLVGQLTTPPPTVGQDVVELICQNARKTRQNEAIALSTLFSPKPGKKST